MIIISTNKSKLQIAIIHTFLNTTYWAKNRSLKEVEDTITHSFCFGMYKDIAQIGFVRVVTDYTTFAYLMDVFILPKHRGKGYSKQLLKTVLEHPKLQSCGTWMLKTLDAQDLYKQFGFTNLKNPNKVMEFLL